MSDERLRALERRFKETGSAEAEAAWLVERVRVGEPLEWDRYSRLAAHAPGQAAAYLQRLTQEGVLAERDLQVLAYLDHPPARELRPAYATTPTDVRAWFGELFRLSPRAAAAVAAITLGDVVAALDEPLDEAVSAALDGARQSALALYSRSGSAELASAAHDLCSEALYRSADQVTNAFAWAGVHISLVATLLTEAEPDAATGREAYLSTPGLRLQDLTRARSAATSTFLASHSAWIEQQESGGSPLGVELLKLLPSPGQVT